MSEEVLPRVEQRSQNFEQNKLKTIKIKIFDTILHYILSILKKIKLFESHCSFKFGVSLELYFTSFNSSN